HGDVLYEALTAAGARVKPLDADRIPPMLEAATLAAEDRRFYSHHGVDLLALVRAGRRDLEERAIVEGGSTITEQTAKLLLQRRDGLSRRGLAAKTRELILALRLEHRFSKPQILALYLNLASYGNQTAGAARASQIYFGVDASMLTAAQAAFLAALPQRPSAFNPWKALSSARARQRSVLWRMAAAGALTPAQLTEARAEQLVLAPRAAPFVAPHFVEMVLGSYGEQAPARITTTLDVGLQREVEGIVAHERQNLRAHGAENVSVVVLDNRTSQWLAWEGSGDYGDARHGGSINGPVVPRQPGSALKPLTYALAFERGRTPASVLPDIPSHFPTAEPGILYSPRNYDGRYRGPLLARRALAGSENVPAVALASDLGISSLLRFLTRAGLTTFDHTASYYGVGLTLGNAEVRLDELVSAYSAFPRGGVWRQPTFVLPAQEHKDVGDPSSDLRLVSRRTAFWITDILSDDEARAFIFGRGGNLEFPFPVAVKTGTSQAYHDNWTIGYTRDVTVGVWVGNFDREPLRDSSGVTGAGPIFHAVMLAAERGGGEDPTAILPVPTDVQRVEICALSGMRATSACPVRLSEWMPAGAEPLPCDWHHESAEGLVTIYPAEYRAWDHADSASSLPSGRSAPAPSAPLAPSAPAPLAPSARSAPLALKIVSPPAGAIYSVDPTLRREFQALPLRAVADRRTTVTWLVDGREIGHADSDRPLSWPLAVGRHEIEVRDADGRRVRTLVIVK
ncbi:MAG: penicillin-binding protein 1C, partial [Vicinamibacterales bacterium]